MDWSLFLKVSCSASCLLLFKKKVADMHLEFEETGFALRIGCTLRSWKINCPESLLETLSFRTNQNLSMGTRFEEHNNPSVFKSLSSSFGIPHKRLQEKMPS